MSQNILMVAFKTLVDSFKEEFSKMNATTTQATPEEQQTVKPEPVAPAQPFLTPQQVAAVSYNNKLLLRQVADYFCRAVPSVPSFVNVTKDINTTSLQIYQVDNCTFNIKWYKKDPNKPLGFNDRSNIVESLNEAFKRINFDAEYLLDDTNVKCQQELQQIDSDYKNAHSLWYLNDFRFQRECQKIYTYYAQMVNSNFHLLRPAFISCINDMDGYINVCVCFN